MKSLILNTLAWLGFFALIGGYMWIGAFWGLV
jgi:hypothetical protein